MILLLYYNEIRIYHKSKLIFNNTNHNCNSNNNTNKEKRGGGEDCRVGSLFFWKSF